MKGATDALATLILALMVLQFLVPNPRDATDPPGGRSNIAIRTDYETGLQYLVTARGGITPRLDGDGAHMRLDRREGEPQ